MANVNDFRKGQAVVTLETPMKRLPLDFPGWGLPNSDAWLLATPAALEGKVYFVSTHGADPQTRYSITFKDGSRLIDAVPGVDFAWVTP